jgi:hypothetical protein
MFRTGLRGIKLWTLVYTGFVAAIVFAEAGIAMTLPAIDNVSPVLIDADVPALRIESILRRSDI